MNKVMYPDNSIDFINDQGEVEASLNVNGDTSEWSHVTLDLDEPIDVKMPDFKSNLPLTD